MHTLYSLIADPYWAEIITIIILGLGALAWVSFIWGNAHRVNTRLSTFARARIYLLCFLVFFCGIIIFGKFIVPKNTKSLLENLGADRVIEFLTYYIQAFLLAILKPLI
ncbi:MAG: hypothetical protein ACQETH_07610 [Candidatus Rifleibacteriota bacterium]